MAEPGNDDRRTPQDSTDWNLRALQRLLWARRWLIGLVAAEVFVITALVTFLRTPMYEASARLQVERSTPKVTEKEDVVPIAWNEFEIQRFYQTQYLLMKDPAVLRDALGRNGVRESLLAGYRAKKQDDAPLPTDDDLVQGLKAALKIEQLEYSNVVGVSYRHPNPQIAANVVNAVVEAYQAFFVKSGLEARQGASDFLQREVETAKADVKQLEKRLTDMRGQIQSVIPASGAEMGKSRLESLDASLTDAKMRLAKGESKLATYEKSKPTALDEVRTDPQVLKYLEHLAALKKNLAESEGKYGENYPALRELRQAVSESEASLSTEQQRVYTQLVQAARTEKDRAERDVARLDALLKVELQSTAQQQKSASEFESVRTEYEQKKGALDALLTRSRDVELISKLQEILKQQITIVDKAKPPAIPASPRVKLNLVIGLAFALLLGIAAAFMAEALDNKVRNAAQLQELSGLPLLGAIPRVLGKEKPRLAFVRGKGKTRGTSPVMAAQQHDAEEAFRALRSNLMLSKAGAPARVLLVTSALPGEGKSTISANIGRTLAMFGHKTVLLDADLRHPRLHRVFKVRPSKGLTNLLVNDAQIEEVLEQTRYPGLALIAGGPCPPDPATLLDPKRLQRIIGDLQQQHGFEFVIIDTPPTLVFADAFNVVHSVEGVVLVGRALVTPKEAVKQAVEALRKLSAPLLGVVLNGEVSEDHSGSYYRYYHYRYGYYQKKAEDLARRERLAERQAGEQDQGDNSAVL